MNPFKRFPIVSLSSLFFLAAASSAFLFPSQTQTRRGSSPTSLASLSYRGYSYDDDAGDDFRYGYGGGGGRQYSRYNYGYGRGGWGSGVLARRNGAYGSGWRVGRYYDDEYGYGGYGDGGYGYGYGYGGYDEFAPREFTPSERKGIRRLQQRRYGGGDYYTDERDYYGGRRGGRGGWGDYYPNYGYGGRGRGRRYGRAIGDFDDGYRYGGRYGYGGRRRGRYYDSYDDYDDYDDDYPDRSYLEDRRYGSRWGRRRGYWGNLVGGAARRSWRSFDNERDMRRE